MTEDFPKLPPVNRTRKDVITGVLILVVAFVVLVAVVVVPLFDLRRADSPDESSPDGSSADMPPSGVLWEAEYDFVVCEVGEDHLLMAGLSDLRLLDLRDGTTTWSVEPEDPEFGATCLANGSLVSIDGPGGTRNPDAGEAIILDTATGKEVTRIPAERARQVVDLGSIIGLVDALGVMSAVSAEDLTTPLWSVPLAADGDVVESATSDVIDDFHVKVNVFLRGQNDEDGVPRVVLLSDGTSPPWVAEPNSSLTDYIVHEGVVLRYSRINGTQQVTALGMSGAVLWESSDVFPHILDSVLYLTDLAPESFTFLGIRRVDPVSGRTEASFRGEFDRVMAQPKGRVGLFSEQEWITLDATLSQEDRQSMSRRILAFADDEHVFVGRFPTDDHERMEAFIPGVAESVWSRDLIPDQRLDKYGPHFITYDEDNGVIQGIEGPD